MIGIKDFGMPSCCVNCQMCDAYEKGMCVITDTECENMYSKRNDDCPLVEITESDDCISRKAMLDAVNEIDDGDGHVDIFICEVREIVMEVPSVNPQNDVLDKIRAEIEQAYCKVADDYDKGRNYGLYMATQIIDKYRGKAE